MSKGSTTRYQTPAQRKAFEKGMDRIRWPDKRQKAIQYLRNLHVMNKLKESDLNCLSKIYGVDCRELCRKYGITYKVKPH